MGFLDKLLAKREPEQADSSIEKISRVYVYLTTSAPVDAQAADEVRALGLRHLKKDATFGRIMAKVEARQIPVVMENGIAASAAESINGLQKWLTTKGTRFQDSIRVEGRSVFVASGSAPNRAAGSAITWGILACCQ